MARTQCISTPEVDVNGTGRMEASKMYKDLILKAKLPRPVVNIFYAALTLPVVEAAMQAKGFTKNSQGQWNYKDVMQLFNAYELQNKLAQTTLDFEKSIGSRDSNGDLIDFTDSEQALNIALQANANNRFNSSFGLNKTVSTVVRKGDKFNVLTFPLTSRNLSQILDTQRLQQKWDLVDQAFQNVGIDLRAFTHNPELINALDGKDIAHWASQLRTTSNNLYPEKQIRTILMMDENIPQVQRLKTMFGSLADVAHKMYEVYQGRDTVTPAQRSLMDSAMDECKKLRGMDVAQLYQDVINIDNNVPVGTIEADMTDALTDLSLKYDIDTDDLFRDTKKRIDRLSNAAIDAAFTIKRQIQKLKNEQGITPEVLNLQQTMDNLIRELKNKRYYAGVIGFLSEATNQVQNLNQLLNNAQNTTGTVLEQVQTKANALQEAKSLRDGYYRIVDALTDLDKIIVDETVNSIDKTTIEDNAKQIKDFFDKLDDKMDSMVENNMIELAIEYLGDSAYNGEPIANIVHMAKSDSTVWDHFYSIGRVSNPILGVMGKVIRDAQSSRTAQLVQVSTRIRRATDKLFKAGHDSSFMYEDIDVKGYNIRKQAERERLKAKGLKGKDLKEAMKEWDRQHAYELNTYIQSDIDWAAYNQAKNQERVRLMKNGYKGMSLQQAMEQWKEAHTEDRIVDFSNGRTERVPDSNYRKEFGTDWDQAQWDYYNEMMQIKGEMGSLLPYYAQKQYLPPQKRRTHIDALKDSKGNPRKIAKVLLNKFKDIYTIREDDTDYSKNGVLLNGEEWEVTNSDMDGTKLREIPIFYINRIKDQTELLKDFSGAMQSLAGTAINYDAMNRVRDTVEMMGDFLKYKQDIGEKGASGRNQVDMIAAQGVKIFRALRKKAQQTGTASLVDSFIDKHLYGVNLKSQGKWTKLVQNLIAYTSLRSLAVNVKGAIANYGVGELQMLIEAGAGEFYNFADWEWAHRKVFGDNTINAPGRIMDFLTNNLNSKAALLAEIFDPLNEQFGELKDARYHRGKFRKMISYDATFAGYGVGEHMIHFVNMYAILKNTKVRIGGEEKNKGKLGLSYYKKYSLYDAFVKTPKMDGNSELTLKPDTEYFDKEDNTWKPVDQAFIDKIRDRIRYCNQTTHGSMNDEDKGVIHQQLYGRFIMNLRQWAVEHYSRRYRGKYWDASLGEWREGYYNTVYKFFRDWITDTNDFDRNLKLNWQNLDAHQKRNMMRALMENLIVASLVALSFGLGEPDDHKKDFWMRMWIYQTKRAILETKGSTPYGIPQEMNTLINSPIAATNTVNAILYPFLHLHHINETIKSGRHKGENKFARNMAKYFLPFYNQIEQMYYFGEDSGVFAVFNDDM